MSYPVHSGKGREKEAIFLRPWSLEKEDVELRSTSGPQFPHLSNSQSLPVCKAVAGMMRGLCDWRCGKQEWASKAGSEELGGRSWDG